MDELESLSHTKWDCKYHVVFIPKCRMHQPAGARSHSIALWADRGGDLTLDLVDLGLHLVDLAAEIVRKSPRQACRSRAYRRDRPYPCVTRVDRH
jgi:hypothetical protein